MRFAMATILLTAAVLKAWQLATVPVLGEGILNTRWFNIFVVQFELLFGIWLLLGLLPKLTWLASVACFLVFSAVSLYLILLGEESCGCFGKIETSPVFTMTLDLVIVGCLLFCRPSSRLFAGHFPKLDMVTLDKRKVLAVLTIWLVLATLATFWMLSLQQWEHPLGTELKGFDGRRLIILEPEKWIDQELPLFPYFVEPHEGDLLKQGKWKLILVHIICEKCQEMLADLETNATENIAIAVIPARSGEQMPEIPFPTFVLNDTIDWFAETPRVIELSEGICVAVEK